MRVGYGALATGTYLLSGSATLNVSGNESVGVQGVGVFNQSGGIHNVGTTSDLRTLSVGELPGSAGLYTLNDAAAVLTVNGNNFIGGNYAGPGGAGTFNLAAGSMTVTRAIKIWNTEGTSFNLSGGALSVGTIDTGGHYDRFNWSGGTLDVTGASGLSIGPSGQLGPTATLTHGKTLSVTNTLAIAPGGLLSLTDTTLSVGSLDCGGFFQFNSGKLRFASSLKLGIGSPMGDTLSLGPNQRVESGAYVDLWDNSLLRLEGGSLWAGNTIFNEGEIQLASSVSRLQGDLLYNFSMGLISGTGHVDARLKNEGVVRVAADDRLVFGYSENSNNGNIQLLGGIIEFNYGLSNGTYGVISGRGTVIVRNTNYLNNSGLMNFSGGITDVYAFTNNSGRINIAGNALTTFHDILNTSSGTVNVAAGSTAVFFGPVTGLSHIVGLGVKDFEDTASGGAIATLDGVTTVGPSGDLSTDSIRDGTVNLTGTVTIAPNGTTAATSRVKLLTIDGSPGNWLGRLDLNNNDLIIDYTGTSPLATVRDQIHGGFASGAWTGKGIATSMGDATHGLGYADNNSLGLASFSGQVVDSTSILIKYTYFGDANLDGQVDITDLGRLATNWQTAGYWPQGDFDYSGFIDISDLGKLATNWQLGVGSPMGPSLNEALASLGFSGTNVPEPASAVLASAAMAFVPRWRRRQRSY